MSRSLQKRTDIVFSLFQCICVGTVKEDDIDLCFKISSQREIAEQRNAFPEEDNEKEEVKE